MKKYKDITEQTFHRLTAIKRIGSNKTKQNSIWEFKCKCGNIVYLPLGSVTSGNTKSCGCWNRELKIRRKKSQYQGGKYLSKFEYEIFKRASEKRNIKFNISIDDIESQL